jgi:acetylornithine deacetylase/succinyl-diaminopimelate desuccinylase-like protein
VSNSPEAFSHEPDLAAIRRDVTALAALERSSARPGELASAAWLAGRLSELGAAEVRVEPYRYQQSYALAHGLHNLAALLATALGGAAGAALAAATMASYRREVSGASQWLRRLLPAGEGANVIARVPCSGTRRSTLLLLAHHDAANTGLFWDPRISELGAARHLRRRRVDPLMAPVELGLALAVAGTVLPRRLPAARAARAVAGAILAVASFADIDIARGATVPGASDNASGVAVCLDLARALVRRPLEHTEVLVVLTGGEEAGMGGMAAFLRGHRASLEPASTFVLGLDTLGAGRPIVATGEGAMREQRYREADIELVERGAALAGVRAPERWRIAAWTDPILAVMQGLPAVSMLSMGPGFYPHYHHPTDTAANVDWESVAACARIAAGTIGAYANRPEVM